MIDHVPTAIARRTPSIAQTPNVTGQKAAESIDARRRTQ